MLYVWQLRAIDALPRFISLILSLYLVRGPSHILVPACGPIKKPKSLASGLTLNSFQSGKWCATHLHTWSWTSWEKTQSGTRTHLGGFRARPAWDLQSLKIGWTSFRCLSCFSTIPMSSAHALTMPACLLRRALSKLARNGSIALLNKNAEAGQPCITPDRNRIYTKMLPLCS